MNQHKCTGSRPSDILFAVMVIIGIVMVINGILTYIVCSVEEDTQDQITELRSLVKTLAEALEKHDGALTTHDTKPEWWQREGE